ncbi:MAG TPA: spore germination protein [Bacillus bacterium]|nr:spore germination protein [Bacillus sp. (in: firmicutes)]
MPAIVGAVNVVSLAASSVMNIGDVFTIAPKSTAKTFAGAGSFITGDTNTVTNYYSNTNTYESDTVDQPMLLNL